MRNRALAVLAAAFCVAILGLLLAAVVIAAIAEYRRPPCATSATVAHYYWDGTKFVDVSPPRCRCPDEGPAPIGGHR